jgi:hypothetical protein
MLTIAHFCPVACRTFPLESVACAGMNEDRKREEGISELIDELEVIREKLFHVQKSLEKIEENRPAQTEKQVTFMRTEYICSLCHRPVSLEENMVDEKGHLVHEDCYIQLLAKTLPPTSTPPSLAG